MKNISMLTLSLKSLTSKLLPTLYSKFLRFYTNLLVCRHRSLPLKQIKDRADKPGIKNDEQPAFPNGDLIVLSNKERHQRG